MNRAKPNRFKVGDWVTVAQIPRGLKDTPDLKTKTVFQRVLGKAFPIEGFDEHGHLELLVARKRSPSGVSDLDTIWIEPEYVIRTRKPRRKR